MKEFDFDELDKAVNSLMGDVKKSDTKPAADSSVTMPEPPATPTATEPMVVLPETPEEPTTSDAPTLTNDNPPAPPSPSEPAPATARPSAPILPPRRGGGRFMDVVHPSSDMSSSAPAASVSTRQGKPLAPITMSDEVKPASPVIDVMAPVTPPSTPEVDVSPTEDDAIKTATNDETSQQSSEAPSSSEPWTSPFLPDTQVEKRPLGGATSPAPATGLSEAIAAELSKGLPSEEAASSNEPDTEPDTKDAEPTVTTEPTKEESVPEQKPISNTDSPAPELQLTPEPSPVAMPAELNNDLVAIESGQNSTIPEAETAVSPAAEPSSTTGPLPPTPLSIASIPPQYDEQPSSGDASHTPIYDNEAAAHQPLAHPAKRKKSWVIIVFILIILAVGGGLGALAYFLGLV